MLNGYISVPSPHISPPGTNSTRGDIKAPSGTVKSKTLALRENPNNSSKKRNHRSIISSVSSLISTPCDCKNKIFASWAFIHFNLLASNYGVYLSSCWVKFKRLWCRNKSKQWNVQSRSVGLITSNWNSMMLSLWFNFFEWKSLVLLRNMRCAYCFSHDPSWLARY